MRHDKDIAKYLAREIFKLGDLAKSPARRIEFKGGEWPDNERAQGGLDESALASFIEQFLSADKPLSGPTP